MWDVVKKYWKDASFFALLITAILFVWSTNRIAVAGSEKAATNQQTIYELAKLTNKVNDNLELLLRLGEISKETYEDLRMLPTEPMSPEGEPYNEWYLVGETEIYLIKIPDTCDATVVKIPFGEG